MRLQRRAVEFGLNLKGLLGSGEPAPKPTINLLHGTTASPYAGQLISLSVSPPSVWTLASQSWSFGNAKDVVGGYNASTASGSVTAVGAANQTNLGYYYIVPGASETVNVTVTYMLAGGSSSAQVSASQMFSVGGPTGATVKTSVGWMNVVVSANRPYLEVQGVPTPSGFEPAPGATSVGAVFSASPVLPSNGTMGAYVWVQLITKLAERQVYALQPNSGDTQTSFPAILTSPQAPLTRRTPIT